MMLVALALVATAEGQTVGPPPVRSFADSAKPSAVPGGNRSVRTSPQVQKYATKSRKFSIPFSLVSPDQVIVEVHLFVSTDGGGTWEEHRRADEQATEFPFEAPTDGEFWFAVQTLNRNGERIPARVTQPELIVVVDTVPPQIEAQSSSDNAGRLVVDWRASDSQLATDTFTIRLRSAGAGDSVPWTNVPAKVTKPASGGLLQDSYAFWPDSNELQFDLEVSIRDQAGNQATTQISAQRTQPTPQFAGNARPQTAASHPLTNPALSNNALAQEGGQPANAQNATGWSRSSNNNAQNTSATRSDPNPGQSVPATTTPQTVASNASKPVEWRSVPHSESGKFLASGSTQNRSVQKPSLNPIPETDDQPLKPADLQAQAEPKSAPAEPARQAMLVARGREPHSAAESPTDLSRATVMPALAGQAISVRSKRFRLNYQVEAIDPAGVKEVAVWTTRDAGKSWARLGSIPNPDGPFPVEVDESGLYGFRLVVISNSGLKSRLPQPGDPADKWVRVDVEPPVARITSAPYGADGDAGKLIIQWEASDDLLAARPIEIAYSDRPESVWTTIEKGLSNSGRYAWSVPSDAPQKIYLRLVVRDEAGNESVDQTSTPVDLSNLYPRGRIQSVEPIGDR